MNQIIQTINTDNGLPNDQIHCIEIDRKGRLLLASPTGLVRYNGSKTEVFDSRNGLNCPGLRTVKLGPEGIIWIGTDRGMEAMEENEGFIVLEFDFEWTFGIAECFYIENRFVWVGTSFGILKLKKKGNHLSLVFKKEYGLVLNIVSGKSGIYFLTSSKKVFHLLDDSVSPFKVIGIEMPDVTALEMTLSNSLLLGVPSGLLVCNPAGEIQFSWQHEGINNPINIILGKRDSWMLGIGKELVILDHDSTKITNQETIKIGGRVKSITFDSFQNIWIGTNDHGIKKIPVLRLAMTQVNYGATESVLCIKKSEIDESIFVGGEGFLSVISPGNNGKRSVLSAHYSVPGVVWDTRRDPKDPRKLYLATDRGLYQLESGGSPIPFEDYNKIATSPNRCLLCRNGEVWVGTIAGLFRLKDGQFEEIFNNKGEKFGYVYSLSLNQDGDIWVATLGQGLWLEESSTFVNLTDKNITPLDNTYCVKTNSKGETIILQQEKVVFLDVELNSEVIFVQYPMAGWSVDWIDDETIAVGSGNGLYYVDVKSKKLIRRVNLLFKKSDWQFTTSRSLLHLENGNLFCGLSSGLLFLDSSKLNKLASPPNLWLDELNWTNVEPEKKADLYRLYSGKWSSVISVYSPWFIDNEAVRFRFKIIGFDEKWGNYQKEPLFKFNSLPAGKYEIQGQVFTPLTGETLPISLLKLEIEDRESPFFLKISKWITGFLKLGKKSRLKNDYLIQQNDDYKKEINQRMGIQQELVNYKVQLEELVEKRTEDLVKAKEKAESADKQKTIFLAAMSHEIRTPLGGIIGLNNLLKETQPKSIQKEYIEKIDYSSHHLLQIINNILDITKIESGQLELENSDFSIYDVIRDIGEFSQIKIGKKPIDIILEHDIKTTKNLIGDSLRIKQVLINLVGNALKFTPSGKIIIQFKELKAKSGKIGIQFSVTDSGIGISESQMSYLFKAFGQADSSITRKYGGTGLGLNISFNFVEMMGGKLSVVSKIGEGSTFSFSLEFELGQEENQERVNLESQFKTQLSNVLIINDNLSENKVLVDQFSGQGIQSKSVLSLFEAKSLIKQETFDLILIDWFRDDLGGESTIENLVTSEENFNGKIIILTTADKANILHIVKKFGVNEVLLKPIYCEKLMRGLASVLTDKPLEKEEEKRVPEESGRDETPKKVIMDKGRILVAEDTPINQLIIKKILGGYGYEVVIANNGKEAVEILEKDKEFSLVLMDIQMPIMDGIEATKTIRQNLKLTKVPIIALTADVTVETKSKIVDFGMNGYLSKPIILDDLKKTLSKVFDKSDASSDK